MRLLPPIRICHGINDTTVPLHGAKHFVQALQAVGVQRVDFLPYSNWSHTYANVEGPMEGDFRFHRDLWQVVQKWTRDHDDDDDNTDNDNNNKNEEEELVWESLGSLCPSILVKLGTIVMPFDAKFTKRLFLLVILKCPVFKCWGC